MTRGNGSGGSTPAPKAPKRPARTTVSTGPKSDNLRGIVDFKALRRARHRAGLTQQQAADRIGLDPSGISKLERGLTVDLTVERLHDLALLYKTSLAEFLQPGALGAASVSAVTIPLLTTELLGGAGPAGLHALLGHWRGAGETVAINYKGHFCVALPNDGASWSLPAGAVAIVDPSDRKLVDDALYLLLHGGKVVARRFLKSARNGQFIGTPLPGGETPRPIFTDDNPEIFGRIVASIQKHDAPA